MTVGAMVLIPSAAGARLGQGQARQASVRASLRLSHRMAALHRYARPRGPDAPPLSERIVKAFADIVDAPGGLLLVSDGGRGLGVAAMHGTGPARTRPPDELGRRHEFLERGSKRAAGSSSSKGCVTAGPMRPTGAAGAATGCSTTLRSGPASPCSTTSGWSASCVLAAPELPAPARLGGFRPAAHGRQPGGELACRSARPGGAEPSAAFRGIQSPLRLHPARHQESGQPVVACSPATPSATPTIPSSAPTWSRRCARRSAR